MAGAAPAHAPPCAICRQRLQSRSLTCCRSLASPSLLTMSPQKPGVTSKLTAFCGPPGSLQRKPGLRRGSTCEQLTTRLLSRYGTHLPPQCCAMLPGYICADALGQYVGRMRLNESAGTGLGPFSRKRLMLLQAAARTVGPTRREVGAGSGSSRLPGKYCCILSS